MLKHEVFIGTLSLVLLFPLTVLSDESTSGVILSQIESDRLKQTETLRLSKLGSIPVAV